MKIRTRGNQAFNVPNDEEGHNFLKLLRKFRNRGWHYRAKGRGSRKEHGCQHGIAQEHSEWMAVYLDHRRQKPQTAFAVYNGVSLAGFADSPPAVNVPGTFTLNMAEWSGPVGMGDGVAIAQGTGLAYASDVHGVQVGDNPVGVAIHNHVGLIGESEATVEVNIFPDPPLNIAVPAQPVQPEPDVELNPDEQILLEDILCKMVNQYEIQEWPEEKQKIFDSLYEKMVD